MNRIVTAIGPDGRSHIVMHESPTRVMRLEKLPGLEFAEVWATDGPTDLSSPHGDSTPSIPSLVPELGGTRFRIVTLPPDRELLTALTNPTDAMEILTEFRAQAPGIADAGELHDPAMHATPTLDYGVVLSGEVLLELDSGESALMRAGDCVVQLGAKHAWRNRSDHPVVLAFVMIGARKVCGPPGTISDNPAS
jgi:mannose-6-phosphate isomerase-like protein (cupin superfamily)